MTAAIDIRTRLARFLDAEVEAAATGDRIAVVTPAEYPDGDAVVVWVAEHDAKTFEVTDLGESDSRLIPDGPGQRAIAPAASSIAERFGVRFDGGALIGRATHEELPEVLWRVAQAASAIAEAATFHRPQLPKEAAFVDLVEGELRRHHIDVNVDAELEGASGHKYRTSLFVPSREAVIEPISGERAWNKAAAVYVEFGDLSRINGYELVAVIDDRDDGIAEDVEGLLGQVAAVTRWRRGRWIDVMASGGLI
jgi:hypothetical protein